MAYEISTGFVDKIQQAVTGMYSSSGRFQAYVWFQISSFGCTIVQIKGELLSILIGSSLNIHLEHEYLHMLIQRMICNESSASKVK